jgi:hypothetical protein
MFIKNKNLFFRTLPGPKFLQHSNVTDGNDIRSIQKQLGNDLLPSRLSRPGVTCSDLSSQIWFWLSDAINLTKFDSIYKANMYIWFQT